VSTLSLLSVQVCGYDATFSVEACLREIVHDVDPSLPGTGVSPLRRRPSSGQYVAGQATSSSVSTRAQTPAYEPLDADSGIVEGVGTSRFDEIEEALTIQQYYRRQARPWAEMSGGGRK
jgi:hypothetical protein